MRRLNFSWVIPNKLAGCAGPINSNELKYLKKEGITLLVRLAERHKANVTPQEVEKAGLQDLHEPVTDFHAPSQQQIDRIITKVKETLDEGGRIAVSCGAGIGRTGTILSCILISLCYTVEEASKLVPRTRKQKRGWETEDQHQMITSFARRVGKA